MMNMFQLQEQLQDFSQQQLAKEMQAPSGNVPQYMVLAEMQRRKRMQSASAADQAQQNQTTVAQDAVAAAGVPQAGIGGMMQAMAPKTDMVQNTGQSPVQQMYGGGVVKAQEGAYLGTDRLTSILETDPATIAMANRMGMSVQEYLSGMDPRARASELQRVNRNRTEGAPSLSDVFDPNRPVYDQGVSPLDIEESFGQMRDNIRDKEVFDMGVNPSYATDVRDRAVGIGISDRPMQAPTMDEAPSLEEFSPFLGDREAPRLDGAMHDPSGLFLGEMTPMQLDALDLSSFASPMPDVGQTASPRPEPERRGYIPPTIGATELNTPAFRNALRGEPNAGLATGLRDAAESAEPSDFWSGVLDDISNTAAILSPFASEEDKLAAAGNLGAVDTGTPLEIPEEGIEALMPPAPAESQPTTSSGAPSGGSSGGSSLGGSGAAVMSDLEKNLEQDKWLALAKFGLGLMASSQPTLGGAIGEAGLGAVGDFQQARQNFEDAKMARAALAARQAAGRGGSGGKPIPAGIIGNLEDRLAAAEAAYGQIPPPETGWFGGTTDEHANERSSLAREIGTLRSQIDRAYGSYGLNTGASGGGGGSLTEIDARLTPGG